MYHQATWEETLKRDCLKKYFDFGKLQIHQVHKITGKSYAYTSGFQNPRPTFENYPPLNGQI